MRRRDFLASTALGAIAPNLLASRLFAHPQHDAATHLACGPTYATVQDAIASPRETLAFVPAIHTGTRVNKPDYFATVDVDPASPTYSKVIHRLPMPHVGDELHHYGWNACSSCHGDPTKSRRYLIVPGIASGRIHIIDAADPRELKMHKVIEPDEIARKANLSAPHTVHCLPDGRIILSMLGDANGDGPGGFLMLDDRFNVLGPWERDKTGMHYNYDFWYQLRRNVMISSEWGAPNTVKHGFKLEDVEAGKYGSRLHFWDWGQRRIAQTIDLGPEGMVPLEVRFHHNPDSTHGFVGAALSSAIFHWYHDGNRWQAKKIVQVEPIEAEGWPFPVPGLITDLVLSMDDRFLYFSNWLHGDLRQYDVSDPANPKLTGRVWLGGAIGKPSDAPQFTPTGGPQMLQLSLDGERLYVTSSLYSPWDNQFYPDMAEKGSYLLQIDCDTDRGGLALNERFHVDFGKEPTGPARAHETRFPGGDCTSDIWV